MTFKHFTKEQFLTTIIHAPSTGDEYDDLMDELADYGEAEFELLGETRKIKVLHESIDDRNEEISLVVLVAGDMRFFKLMAYYRREHDINWKNMRCGLVTPRTVTATEWIDED